MVLQTQKDVQGVTFLNCTYWGIKFKPHSQQQEQGTQAGGGSFYV